MGENDDFEESLRLIRQRFIDKLGDMLPGIQTLRKELDNDTLSHEEDMRMQMHRLAGSAGSFGFDALSAQAAKIERRLDYLIEGAPLTDFQVSLKEALDAFLKEAERILGQGAHAPEASSEVAGDVPQDYDFHILVADDDELVRDLLAHGLSQAKCRITPVENGVDVLQHIAKAKPDLIVLDVNMPGMNGFEVLETLKSDPQLQAIPVIMLTGSGEDEHVIKGISSGALDYVTKPFEVQELVTRIVTALRRHDTKVLLADDDALIRDLLTQRFYRMGYRVITAGTGNEALARIHAEQPDIAILDVMMPGMDGLAVLRQMRDNPAVADIPVVILTAKTQQENVLQGLETGAHDYITKPFDVDEVAARVSGILQRRKTA